MIRCSRSLAPHRRPYQLGIQFIQVGDDPDATAFLMELDDDLKAESGVRDIVDTSGPFPHLLITGLVFAVLTSALVVDDLTQNAVPGPAALERLHPQGSPRQRREASRWSEARRGRRDWILDLRRAFPRRQSRGCSVGRERRAQWSGAGWQWDERARRSHAAISCIGAAWGGTGCE